MKRAFAIAFALVGALGCSTGKDFTQTSSTPPPAETASPHSTAPTTTITTAQAHPADVSEGDVKQVAQLEKDYKAAKADYAAKPGATTKGKLVTATVKYGTAAMMTNAFDQKVKYAKALGLYREALKLDPKNAEAKSNADMIVSIYKSMGRPVPQ